MRGLCAYNLAARYNSQTVLNDVTLTVPSGAITVLLGANGAGKSTLLNMLSGDLKPSFGRVEFDGVDISGLSALALADLRAVLPQGSPLSFPYTVYEIVRLGLRDQRDSYATDQAVRAVLAETDLGGYGARHFQELSGGEQQRVHIARVLAQLQPVAGLRPSVLLLDEPTSSLDLKHQYRAMEIARRFASSGGTVVAVLHDLNLAATHADQIVMLANGTMLAQGNAAETLTQPIIAATFQTEPRLRVDERDRPFILPPISGLSA